MSSNRLHKRMHNHTDCICLTFLCRAFSNVFSNCLLERMQSHTGCICSTFLHYASSNVSSNCLPEKMHNHTGCICLIFPFAHGQLFHWNSSAWNYHAQGFVPLPTSGKVCLLLLTVLNWENSDVKLLQRKRKWKGKYYKIQKEFVLFGKDWPGSLKVIRHQPKFKRHLPHENHVSIPYLYAMKII